MEIAEMETLFASSGFASPSFPLAAAGFPDSEVLTSSASSRIYNDDAHIHVICKRGRQKSGVNLGLFSITRIFVVQNKIFMVF
jgi:hypothetical protein